MRKNAWDAVLNLLRDLKVAHPSRFRNKVFLCYGDFRQIPPVMPKAGRDQVVRNTVRCSSSWPAFDHVRLQQVYRQGDDAEYAAFLDRVGDGSEPAADIPGAERGSIFLPHCKVIHEESEALGFCFPNLNDPRQCAESKVLAATNSLVDVYNSKVLHTLVHTYRSHSLWRYSSDSIDVDPHGHIDPHMSADFMHMQQPPGVPPHQMQLVVGALYELMRNFSAPDRLMNHTPVVLTEVHDHHVVVESLEGAAFLLPRICFRWVIASGATTMTRRQYPLRPAYAATYNGCQGTTLRRVVFDARRSPFSHGHLYVALSRVRHRDHIRVLVPPDQVHECGLASTKNIVWPELLLQDAGATAATGPRVLGKRKVLRKPAGAKRRK